MSKRFEKKCLISTNPPKANLVAAEKLSKTKKVIYSIGRIGSTGLITFVTLTSFYFYLEFASVNPLLNSIVHSLSRFFMAISGLVVGYMSDIFVHSKIGKRKPFILAGTLVLSFSFAMLYNPIIISIKHNILLLILYEFTWLTLIGIGYSTLIIPYLALIPEISNPSERPVISFYQNIFNILGDGIGIGASFALSVIMKYNYQIFYNIILAIAFLTAILYLPMLAIIKVDSPNLKKLDPVREANIIARDKNFWYWELTSGLVAAGLVIFTSMVVDLALNYLQLINPLKIPELSFFALSILISIPFIMKKSHKTGLKKTMYASLLLMSFSLIILSTIPWITDYHLRVEAGVVAVTFTVIGLAGYWIFTYAVTANIIDMNIRETGESRAGTYMGVDNINSNIFQSIGYLFLGISIEYLGWISELSWSLIAGILIFASTIPLKIVKMEIVDEETLKEPLYH